MLSGEYSPSGRLPVTFYYQEDELPDITDYKMQGRTYRFLNKKPLYPFGFGLSYTDFKYNNLEILSEDELSIKVKISLTNKGNMKALEKVQIYAKYDDSRTITPNSQLCAFSTVDLDINETKEVELEIDKYWIKAILENGERVDPNGKITLYAGGHQPDELSESLYKYNCIKAEL